MELIKDIVFIMIVSILSMPVGLMVWMYILAILEDITGADKV